MSDPLRIIHGDFGRVALLRLDQSMVRHAHTQCHIIFKVGGPDIRFGVRQHEHLVTNNSVLLVNAWEPHFYLHRSNPEPTILLALYLNPLWLKALDSRFMLSAHPKFFNKPIATVPAKLSQLRDDSLEQLVHNITPLKPRISELMAEIFLEVINIVTPRTLLLHGGMYGELGFDSRIRIVVEHILHSNDEPATLDELASSIGLSRAQFFRLFTRTTGLPPATFINMVRMEACLKGVALRNLSMQAIAEQVGFLPASNFTRFFSGQQGVSPNKYRKAMDIVV